MSEKGAITSDIKKSWLNPIRAAQAVCKDNKGIGIVTIRVVVKRNMPMLWTEPTLTKIHPAKAAEWNVTMEIVESLSALGEITGGVDNNE